MRAMRRFIRDHSLSIVALGAFVLLWLGGQAWAGHRTFNEEQRAHGEPTVSFGEYLTRADFGEATFENWESEFLQMGLYVLLTAWLVQKGSAESKPADGDPRLDADPREHRDDPEAPWPVRHGGWVLRLYEHSLSIAMLTLFALAFAGHLVTPTEGRGTCLAPRTGSCPTRASREAGERPPFPGISLSASRLSGGVSRSHRDRVDPRFRYWSTPASSHEVPDNL